MNDPILKEQLPFSLVGGGDCYDHFHSADRAPTQDTLDRLHDLEVVVAQSTSYTCRLQDDFVLMDATGGVRTVTLPAAIRGKHIIVERTAGANNVTIAAQPSVLMNGTTAVVLLTTSFSPARLKAVVIATTAQWINA